MARLRNFFILASLFLAFSISSLSQVTVTATLTDGTGTIYRTGFLRFQLVNCGQNVPVTSTSSVVVQDTFDLRPASPGGSISGTVLGNDQILCGNVKSTYYVVTPMKDSTHPLRDGIPYVICSATATLTTCGNAATLGSFNFVTALPMTQQPPTPGFVLIYGNPTNTQTINQPTGTEIDFKGTVNFCSATILCGGSGGSGGGNPVLENCTPDQTGNSFFSVTPLTNYFNASWQFVFGQASYIVCQVYIPTAASGATLVLDIAANDATAGHTANFQTCDGLITTGSINIGALTCAANQTFTTTATAYNRVSLTFNVQSTLSNGSILVVKIATSTTGTAPAANMLVYPHFIL